MTIATLMGNPAAAKAYLDIDSLTPPATLADNYKLAKLAGDVNQCTAIEARLRQLAQIRFDKFEVLEALRDMERVKAMRKPGTRAPAALQAIASEIEASYASGNYARLPDGRVQFHLSTGTRITCKDMPGAVAMVCAKYRRGLPRGFGNGRAG